MDLGSLLHTLPRPGRVVWIGLRTARRGPIEVVDGATAIAGIGLEGDRRATPGRRPTPTGKRHVTLLQGEHLATVGALLGREPVDPVLLRRNLVVTGCNLRAFTGRRFRVGDVVLEGTGECHPCSRMEEALGPGGYQAMRGHGGLNARIVSGGHVRVGDVVDLLVPDDRSSDDTSDQSLVATGRAGSADQPDHDAG
jgi:MOSC domain-containing protein YiiM